MRNKNKFTYLNLVECLISDMQNFNGINIFMALIIKFQDLLLENKNMVTPNRQQIIN